MIPLTPWNSDTKISLNILCSVVMTNFHHSTQFTWVKNIRLKLFNYLFEMLWVKPSNSYILCRSILPLSYILNSGLPSCQQCVTHHIRQQTIKIINTPSVTINHEIPWEPIEDTGKKTISHIWKGFWKNGWMVELPWYLRDKNLDRYTSEDEVESEMRSREKKRKTWEQKMLWFIREWVESDSCELGSLDRKEGMDSGIWAWQLEVAVQVD